MMKDYSMKWRVIRPLALFVTAGVVIGAASCTRSFQRGDATQASTDSVQVAVAVRDLLRSSVVLPGTLLPNQAVDIHAKVSGYVKQLPVDIGSEVRKGQTLAVVEAPEVLAGLGRVSEKSLAASAKFKSSLDTYSRLLTASQSPGVVSLNELARARNAMLADSAELRAAMYDSAVNRAAGDYLTIVAPFDGVVTRRNVNVGAFVGSPREIPMLVVEDVATLRLQISVPEVYAGTTAHGGSVSFTTIAFPQRSFSAAITRRSDRIDDKSRSETWEFDVPNNERVLKAGMYVDAKCDLERGDSSILVPQSAVMTNLERKFVIAIKDGMAAWIDVRTGLARGDKVEVFGAIEEGCAVVLHPAEEMKPGTKVQAKM
jgi:RND family efflux transporter MFP subunit